MVVAVPRKAPLLGGEERDAKTDHHQGDTKCRPSREGGFEGDDPGYHRNRAKRHQQLIASDPVSRLASARSRSASSVVSLPSSTNRVISRTILMAVPTFR